MIGVLVGLLCATTWACGSILIRDLSRKLDPFTLNAPRALIGGITMFLIALATGRTAQYGAVTPEKLFFLLASIGVGGGIGDTFYTRSIARIGVSQAFPIASTYPAMTLVLGLLFLHETTELSIVLGLALVVGGIVLISRRRASADPADGNPSADGSPSVDRNASVDVSGSAGIWFALVAAACWAVGMILVAPGMEGLDSIMVASFRTPALALMLWGVVAVRGTFPTLRQLSRSEWVIMVVGGIVGWGLGSVLFLLSVNLVGPTRAAILTSTSPLFALPLSAIFLKEQIHRSTLVGTALTIIGVILVSRGG